MTRTQSARSAGVILAAALALTGLAGGAHAQDPVDLKVVDRGSGQVLPIWRHDGRLYVAGRPGARYALRVTNHTDGRVLVVMSVDGVNVVSGETAGWGQRGYIFDPHESYDVNGWRKSEREVADFTFAPLSQSYAARTGRPADVGVIGIAVFNEKVWYPPPEAEGPAPRRGADDAGRYAQRETDQPAARKAAPPPPPPSSSSELATAGRRAAAPSGEADDRLAAAGAPAPRDEKLGTGHGAREGSVVNVQPFERATERPMFVRQIEYDTYAHLVAAGVINPYADEQRHPRPFPTNPYGEGYVPDPPDDP